MRVEVLRSLTEVDALRRPWEDLFARSGSSNYFVSYAWIRFCVAHFMKPGQWSIVIVMDGDEAIALAPLRHESRVWTFLMVANLADYCEILCDPKRTDGVALLVRHLTRQRGWRRMRLSGIPAHAPSASMLPEALKASGVPWLQRVMYVSPVVTLSGTFDEYQKKLAKKVRQEIRTTRNHLNRLGEWRFAEARYGQRALHIYDRLVAMHLDRQEVKVGASLFEDEETRAFLRLLIPVEEADRAATQGAGPVLTALLLDDRVVAAAYSLSCGATFFYWIPSFEPNLKSVSLGKALIAHLIETRYREGGRVFDFMGGSESYKFQWSNAQYDVLELELFRSRLGLLASRGKLWLLQRLRTIFSAVPILRNVRLVLSKIR